MSPFFHFTVDGSFQGLQFCIIVINTALGICMMSLANSENIFLGYKMVKRILIMLFLSSILIFFWKKSSKLLSKVRFPNCNEDKHYNMCFFITITTYDYLSSLISLMNIMILQLYTFLHASYENKHVQRYCIFFLVKLQDFSINKIQLTNTAWHNPLHVCII